MRVVTGYLMKVNFVDGQNVKKGELLYEIDPRPYQAALDRAKGESVRLLALADKAKADLARSERLRPSGAISQDEYEQHVANLAVYRASIQSAEAAVRDAELNLEFTKIISPIAGRVSRTRITEGNLVQSGAGDATLLTTVVTTNPIYVYFNIDEHVLLQYQEMAFKTGQELHPNILKDLQLPVEIGLGQRNRVPARRHPRFLRQQDRSQHGHEACPWSFREHQGVSHARFVRSRADSVRRGASGDVGQRASDWNGSEAKVSADGEPGRRGGVPRPSKLVVCWTECASLNPD